MIPKDGVPWSHEHLSWEVCGHHQNLHASDVLVQVQVQVQVYGAAVWRAPVVAVSLSLIHIYM